MPAFENSPSNIPRPKLEPHASSTMQSDTGNSTLSVSRQKQTKRDEVGRSSLSIPVAKANTTYTGYPEEDGGGPQ